MLPRLERRIRPCASRLRARRKTVCPSPSVFHTQPSHPFADRFGVDIDLCTQFATGTRDRVNTVVYEIHFPSLGIFKLKDMQHLSPTG
jgi:hypothetical protein